MWFESASFFFSLNPDELRGAGRRGCNIPCRQGLSDQGQRSWAKDASRNMSYRLLGGSELSHSFDGRCIVGLGPLGRGYDQLPPPRLQPLQPNLPALQRILKKSPKDHQLCPSRAQPLPALGLREVWTLTSLLLLSPGFFPAQMRQGENSLLGFP